MQSVTVYKLTNSETGKCYIGATSQKLSSRFKQGKGYKKCSRMWDAIQQYGWETFSDEILAICNPQAAEIVEKYFIAKYKSNEPQYGYNLEAGGKHKGQVAEETRHKLQITSSYKRSEAWCIRNGEIHKGMKHSEAARKRMSKSQKAFYRSESGREIAKARAAKISKPIAKLDESGKVIEVYCSIAEAAKSVGVATSGISRCCKGEQKQSAGYKWRVFNNDR